MRRRRAVTLVPLLLIGGCIALVHVCPSKPVWGASSQTGQPGPGDNRAADVADAPSEAPRGGSVEDAPEGHLEQPVPAASEQPSLEAKKNTFRAQWQEYVGFVEQTPGRAAGSYITIYRNKTAPLDDLLMDVFSHALRESGSFDGAMKQLQDLVKWQEISGELVMGGLQEAVRDSVGLGRPEPILPGLERSSLEEGADKSVPIIVYLLPEGSVNSEVGFFINAYTTKAYGGVYRIRTRPYSFILSDGKVRRADLTREYTYAGSEPWAGGHNMLMVDTFDTDDALPFVVMVVGPGGSAGKFYTRILRCNDAKDEWRGFTGSEHDGVVGWSYDKNTKILEVLWHHPEEEGRIDRLDMRELLKESLERKAEREAEMYRNREVREGL